MPIYLSRNNLYWGLGQKLFICVFGSLPNTENTEASKRLREVVPKKGIVCTPFDPVPLLETYLITITACIQ